MTTALMPVRTPTRDELLKTPALYREWLESHDPDEAVGKSGCTTLCPVRNFLSEKRGDPEATYTFWKDYEGTWHYRYVRKLDARVPSRVAAGKALEILDEIEAT